MSETKLTAKDYKGELPPVWCPGCGDFAVLAATQKALAERGIKHEDVVFVSGIGCSSRFPHFMKAYGFHSVHGRALPVGVGLRLALEDPSKHVIVVGGDGDGMAIGGGHFIHTARRNPNITYIMMDNEIYGLTKGQISPTSVQGLKTKTTPYQDLEKSADSPLEPLALSILAGATFAARAFSGKIKELTDIIGKAIDHEGYSFVQAISPCVTFNDIYENAKERHNELSEEYDLGDRVTALGKAMEDNMRTGIFFESKKQTLDGALSMQRALAADKKGSGLAAMAVEILANKS